jgi:hypothetical protein
MDQEEMTYTEGGKTYYNKAGTLANTCQVNADLMLIEAAALGLTGVGAGGITAFICSHNANMYMEAKSKCQAYSENTYITLTINYSNPIWISSTAVKRGK